MDKKAIESKFDFIAFLLLINFRRMIILLVITKMISSMLMMICFLIIIPRYYFRKERPQWRLFLDHHLKLSQVLTGTIIGGYLMVAFLSGIICFYSFGNNDAAFICEAGFAFIANLILTNNLDMINWDKGKNKVFLGIIIVLSTLQYCGMNIYYAVIFLRSSDVWLGILVNTILLIFINVIHLWRILNINIKLESLLITGLFGIGFIEIILYGSIGALMINNDDWNRVINCDVVNYFDKFIFLLAVGIDNINQFKPLTASLSTKDILVYCVGNVTNLVTAGFFISYITSATFELTRLKSNRVKDK